MFYPPSTSNAQMAAVPRRLGEPAKSTRMRRRAPDRAWDGHSDLKMALRHRRGPPHEARLRCRWEPMFELDPGRVKRLRVEVLDIVERLRQKFRSDW
jgi:hypothetical protein